MELTDLIVSPEELEPETLDKLYPELNPQEREYIFVCRNILHNDFVFEDMDVFENAVQVLNNISPDVNKTEGVLPEWIWNALRTIVKLRPDAKFSIEVREFVTYICKSNGLLFMPDMPGFSHDLYLDKVIELSKNTPLPETKDGIQTMRYLNIIEYLKGVK